MHPIAFFYPSGHESHSREGHPERPERVEAIRSSLDEEGIWQKGIQVEPAALPLPVLQAIHTQELLDRVRSFSEREQDYDLDTYLTKASWQLALNAAGGAAALAGTVWRRDAECGFALTRPPGHHATRSAAMGFCLLNNVALAAQSLIHSEGAKRVAIIDMDVHHGNGTQDIFYERDDVLFISTHQVPLYPGGGQLNERGRGAGEGKTVNIPLPPNSGDYAFATAYREIIPTVLDRFQPEMLLVSFGFDSHWKDPLANLLVSARGYGEAVKSLSDWAKVNASGRIALILEGGYDLDAAAACGLAATQALLGQKITDRVGPARDRESENWKPILNTVKQIWDL
jgi:acetoin utilization deacetylase AcuC-like enzyme